MKENNWNKKIKYSKYIDKYTLTSKSFDDDRDFVPINPDDSDNNISIDNIEEVSNPTTGDNIGNSIVLFIFSFTIISIYLFLKKKRPNV